MREQKKENKSETTFESRTYYIITAYERLFKTEGAVIDKEYFTTSPKSTICVIARFAIDKILNIKPIDARYVLSFDVLEKLKLLPYIKQYMQTEYELYEDEEDFIAYFLSILYPTHYKFNQHTWTQRVAERSVMDAKNEKRRNFPQNFFTCEEALFHSQYCFRYMLKDPAIHYSSVEELYEIFSNYTYAYRILKAHSLHLVCKNLYNDSPLEYLHASLLQPDNYYYYLHKFEKSFSQNKPTKRFRKKKLKVEEKTGE